MLRLASDQARMGHDISNQDNNGMAGHLSKVDLTICVGDVCSLLIDKSDLTEVAKPRCIESLVNIDVLVDLQVYNSLSGLLSSIVAVSGFLPCTSRDVVAMASGHTHKEHERNYHPGSGKAGSFSAGSQQSCGPGHGPEEWGVL